MAKSAATGRKPKEAAPGSGKRQRRDPGLPTHCFSVLEFCDAHRISRARYYELKALGLAPVEMHIGKRRIISTEAAEQWRRQREAVA